MKIRHVTSGQLAFGEENEYFQTVLGSCVSVCIYDYHNKIGGMIHYLLPYKKFAAKKYLLKYNPLNFAEYAIPLLLKEFKKRDSNPKHLTAYLFGGGQQEVNDQKVFENLPQVGFENIKAAYDILKKFNIKITKEKLQHTTGAMLVRFNPYSGKASFSLNAVSNTKETYKVLIVDDSMPIRKIIRNSLSVNPKFEIVGEATDAFEAEKLRVKLKPDVMTLDIQMSKKDGVTYLKEIMRLTPMPVVIVSDLSLKEVAPLMDALETGAFDYLQKPAQSNLVEFNRDLNDKVLSAAKYSKKIHKQVLSKNQNQFQTKKVIESNKGIELIAIGSSTGGIEALRDVFSAFPKETPPILVVQHIPAVFSAAFAERLNTLCKIKVKEAADGDYLEKSFAYIAPGGKQMRLEKKAGRLQIKITNDEPVNRFKPSVDYLFESLVKLNLGRKLHAAIFTGMGDDGAKAMLKLKQQGSQTFAQNEESCVVFGMPKAAIELNAVTKVVELKNMAPALLGVGLKIA